MPCVTLDRSIFDFGGLNHPGKLQAAVCSGPVETTVAKAVEKAVVELADARQYCPMLKLSVIAFRPAAPLRASE